MNKFPLVLLSFLFLNVAYSQQAFKFDLFTAQLNGPRLIVKNNTDKIVYEMTFNVPHDFTFDLDGDSVDEYIIVDSSGTADLPDYKIYVFNTIDEFSLADSIDSGITEPYNTFSDEEGGEIIVTGNPDFEQFKGSAKDSEMFLPINCWKYDSGQLYLINADIYNLFIQENEEIIDYLDSFSEESDYTCDMSKQNESAISAAYANFTNAGETTIAMQFIKKYYRCDDVDVFLRNINQILNREDSQ